MGLSFLYVCLYVYGTLQLLAHGLRGGCNGMRGGLEEYVKHVEIEKNAEILQYLH